MHLRSVAAFVALGSCLAAIAPGPAVARRHGNPTGLPAISFAQVPPDFAFDTGAGPDRLSAHFGKPVVVNFWATWCAPCLDELPVFAQMQTTYGDSATLITLSKEEAGTARAFLAAHHVALPLVEDPSGKIFDAYTISLLPVTIVLRPDGTVSHVSVGELDWKELRAAIDAAAAPPAKPT